MGYLDAIERLAGVTKDTTPLERPWLKAWQELARLTYGIEPGDPRLAPVLDALNQCDEAFSADDWDAFQHCAQEVKTIVRAPSSADSRKG